MQLNLARSAPSCASRGIRAAASSVLVFHVSSTTNFRTILSWRSHEGSSQMEQCLRSRISVGYVHRIAPSIGSDESRDHHKTIRPSASNVKVRYTKNTRNDSTLQLADPDLSSETSDQHFCMMPSKRDHLLWLCMHRCVAGSFEERECPESKSCALDEMPYDIYLVLDSTKPEMIC